MRLFYVAGQLIDLFPGTVIAQTLQVFDPGKIGSIYTSYTSAVKAPLTQNNRKIFGFLDNTKTRTDIPYTSLECSYFESGIPVIRKARLVINNVTKREIAFTVYSGAWGFFEQIQDRTLWDLDFSDINGVWSQATRDGYRNATTGILQALVDDGRLAVEADPWIYNIGSSLRCPQIYYHTIIDKIFEGFEVTGDIFDNPIFKVIAMPLGVVYNDASFLENAMFFAAAPGGQVITDPVVEEMVIFNRNVKQGSDNFYDGISQYIVSNPDTAERFIQLRFNLQLVIEVTGGTVDIQIESPPDPATIVLNCPSGTYDLAFTPIFGHRDGDTVKVTIIKSTGTPVVTIVSGTFYTTPPFKGFPVESSLRPDMYVYFNKLFEEIKIIDFLKDFCVRFNVQITQRNNVLEVNTLNKILDVFTGPDWTTKRDDVSQNTKYLFNTYGRTNYLKSPTDSDFTPNLTDAYGDGNFPIPNENLKGAATLYTSIFSVTEMVTAFGVFMLKLNLVEFEESIPHFVRMPGNRLFFVRDKYDFEPDVLYDSDGIARDNYKVGYYFDPNQDYEMSFQFFIDNFYQKFIDRCLRRTRLIEREYNLSDLDIFQFNQQVPIYDDNERFLVTKINNRVSKKACKVELLRIESNPEVTYKEQYLNITIVNFLQQMGEASNVRNFLQVFAATITSNLPLYSLRLQVVESVTGNPTWRSTSYNGTTTKVQNVSGNGSNTVYIDTADYVSIQVVKVSNDGNGPDGFPVVPGYVEFILQGVRRFTKTFHVESHSNIQGLNYTFGRTRTLRTAVRAAATAAGNLATAYEAGDVLDGVTLISGDRILLTAQSPATQNGVYQVEPSGAPFRPLDNDLGPEISDTAVAVTEGTINGGKFFECTNTGTLNPGITPITYRQYFVLLPGNAIRINIFEDGSTP